MMAGLDPARIASRKRDFVLYFLERNLQGLRGLGVNTTLLQ